MDSHCTPIPKGMIAVNTRLLESRTLKNLMRAFAGESQARNRYTFAAGAADHAHLRLVGDAFRLTAAQEKEHAELFYGLMADASGQTVIIDGGYPADLGPTPLEQLKAAVHNETEEWSAVYPNFAAIAREEGFARVGDVFAGIAAIERTHALRFGQYAEALENGSLFRADGQTAWLCLNCGHIHFGPTAPEKCPICQHDQGHFIRTSLYPFAVLQA